jgi:hypothetical protein
MSILDRFSKYLKESSYPENFEGWHVKGMLIGKSNQLLKFDVRGMTNVDGNKVEKEASFKSKADKMIFELSEQWVIVDIEELHKYVKETSNKDINLETILKEFQWNLIIPK